MSSRKVYIDYGTGERDISSLVRDDLTVTNRAFSDDYKYAQNVANYTVNYETALYNGLKNATSDIKTRIIDVGNGINPQGIVVPSGLAALYSFNDMPAMPDGATYSYKRLSFTASDITTTNEAGKWNNVFGIYSTTITLDGALIKGAFAGAGIMRINQDGRNARFRVRIKTDLPTVNITLNNDGYSATFALTAGQWQVCELVLGASYQGFLDVEMTGTGNLWIEQACIGDGSYALGWPRDNSGKGQHGLSCVGVVPCEGVSGMAAQFDRVSSRARLPGVGMFATDYYISWWEYDLSTDNRIPWSAGEAAGSGVYYHRGERLNLRLANSTDASLTMPAAVATTWRNYIFVYYKNASNGRAANTVEIWINGSLYNSFVLAAAIVPSAVDMWLGTYNGDVGTWNCDCRLDEVRRGTRALAPEEITLLYSAKDMFNGIIPTSLKYSYNGILENTQIALEATDDSVRLDKRCGDICYRNYYVMNASDIAHSIVHQLAYLAGYTEAQIDGNVHIHTVVEAFSPPSEDESIFTLLNIFLYEYGYALSYNASGQISPIKWNSADTYIHQFDDTNIIESVERSEDPIEYEGVEITYNELGERSNVLLYREDLPYNSTGGFAGYALTSGYMYPAEANVIDDTTGKNQVVDYVYTDESIKYFTNKAVVKGIQEQWNYKAFSSDFSSIVATSGHKLQWNAGPNAVVVTSGYDVVIDGVNIPTYYFGNKKARVIVKNNGANTFLYYLNINGDVLYRTADRKLLVQNVANTTKIDKYTANFLYNATNVSALATGMAKEYQAGNTRYTFRSEDNVLAGQPVLMYLDDGTNQEGVVLEKRWDERTGLLDYIVKSRSSDRGALTQRRISRFSNSTKQMYLYKGDTLVVAASGYQGYDAHYYCTGANDDVQIQAAIDYLSATFGGGTVQLVSGEYDCHLATINLKSGIVLGGSGQATIIYGASTAFLLNEVDNVEIKDLLIDGSKTSYADNVINCIDNNIGTSNTISHIRISNYTPHINATCRYIYSEGTSRNVYVIYSIFDDIISTSGDTSIWAISGVRGATGNKIGTVTKYGGGVAFGFVACNKCLHNDVYAASTAKYYQSYADTGTANACSDNYQGGFNS
jgi:hypothetical protein